MSNPTAYICKTCNRTLDTYLDDNGVRQMHTVQDSPADHTPVPMPMPEAWADGRCDFCNGRPALFVLPAHDFVMPYDSKASSVGDWAMCDECADLVRKDRWTALTRRAVDSFVVRHGPMMPQQVEALTGQMSAAYRRLRLAINGAVRPVA